MHADANCAHLLCNQNGVLSLNRQNLFEEIH